ncbi:hypothetical protein ACHAPI_002805 [Fusarium lateritium]
MGDACNSEGGEEAIAPDNKARKKAKKNNPVDEQWSLKEMVKTKPQVDQTVAKKLKKFWDENWNKFPESMRASFMSTFKKVNQTESNIRSPSNHIIWKTTITSCKEDLDWGVWIILRTIYYDPVLHSKDQKDIAFKGNFMQNQAVKRIEQRYPGVDIFTVKLPAKLDSPRPSDWPALGSPQGFPKLKEETPNKKRARSSTATPKARGSTELTSGRSDSKSSHPGSLFGNQAPYGEGRQHQLTFANHPRKKLKIVDKIPMGRARSSRKIPGTDYVDSEEDNESDSSILPERAFKVPRIGAYSEQAGGLTKMLSALDNFHHDASPFDYTIDDAYKQLKTNAEALESREVCNENQLVVAVTAKIKKDIGISSKDDVLKLITHEIKEMMESPEGVYALEHLNRQAMQKPDEPPFKSTIRYFLLKWVKAITEAVKNELIEKGSQEENHTTGESRISFEKTSEAIDQSFRQARLEIERMADIFNPQDLVKRLGQDVLTALFKKFADKEGFPGIVFGEEFLGKLQAEAKAIITDQFSQLIKTDMQEWVGSVARNAVLLHDAEFRVKLGKLVKEKVKECAPQPSIEAGQPTSEISRGIQTAIRDYIESTCDAWVADAVSKWEMTASTNQIKIHDDGIKYFNSELDKKTQEFITALSSKESQVVEHVLSQVKNDYAQWVEAKIQETILKKFGDTHQLGSKDPTGSTEKAELNLERKIRTELRAVLDAEVKQAVSEAIVDAQSHGQLAFTKQGAAGPHSVPFTTQTHMFGTQVQSLKSLQDKMAAFESVVDCTYPGRNMAKMIWAITAWELWELNGGIQGEWAYYRQQGLGY